MLEFSDRAGEDQQTLCPPRPPLHTVNLSRVIPHHQFNLADQGWTTITYDSPTDELYTSSLALIQASKAFFNLPTSYKNTFQTKHGSEEGWSSIDGEKEFITLRTLAGTPKELVSATAQFWAEASRLLNNLLGQIDESLGLPADALTIYTGSCLDLSNERHASMLRLFKYEPTEGLQPKTVAEAHRDLGLLSLVISDTPGLEVWNSYAKRWFPVELSYQQPAGSLLVGRQLERLSNGRYRSGPHLVRSYPTLPTPMPDFDSPESQEIYQPPPRCRYSLVFTLRAGSMGIINSDNLTTEITGQFSNPIRGITARQLFFQMKSSHFNINAGIRQRDDQKQKLAERKNEVSNGEALLINQETQSSHDYAVPQSRLNPSGNPEHSTISSSPEVNSLPDSSLVENEK